LTERVFVRKASGLVRDFSTGDAMMYNMLTVGILSGAVYAISTALYAFPGANLLLGMGITAVWGAFMWIVYVFLVTAMPRTGGDYIYESRILNSAIGFIFPMGAFVFWCIYWVIFGGTTLAIYGVNPFLATLALRWNRPELLGMANWLLTADGSAIVALVMLFLATILLILPVRFYTRIQWILMGSVLLSIIVILGSLLSVDQATFVANFNGWARQFGASGNYYQHVIDTAKANGFNPSPGFSWYATLGVMPATWFLLAWAFWSVAQAGEVKRAENVKQQFIMIPGAGLLTAVVWIVIALVAISIVGQEFIASLTFLTFQHPDLLATSVPPYTSFFASIARPELDLLVAFVVMAGFFCSTLQIDYNTLFMPVRNLLAGSFDRVLPEAFSEVHPKFHTPVKAILFCLLVGIVQIAAWRFIPGLVSTVAAASFAQQAPLLLTCIAGVIFPFRRKTKEIYASSPGAKYKVAGIPLISICGVIGAGLIVTVIYYWATVPALGVADPTALSFVVGVYAFMAIYYFAARIYRKRQGVDITKAFHELPPM